MREASIENSRLPNTDHSGSERFHQLKEKKSSTCPEFSDAIAEFTLRAGGRMTTVTMHSHGGIYSHMELCTSEHLSREQWMQLCDNIQIIAHAMILLDHPDDNG